MLVIVVLTLKTRLRGLTAEQQTSACNQGWYHDTPQTADECQRGKKKKKNTHTHTHTHTQ
jgi:hypothetical protein